MVVALAAMVDGDTLQVSGALDQAGQIDASLVQDMSQTTQPTPYSYQVTGTLATVAAGLLCLQNASATGGVIAPNALATTLCADGDLPVIYTSNTELWRTPRRHRDRGQRAGSDRHPAGKRHRDRRPVHRRAGARHVAVGIARELFLPGDGRVGSDLFRRALLAERHCHEWGNRAQRAGCRRMPRPGICPSTIPAARALRTPAAPRSQSLRWRSTTR